MRVILFAILASCISAESLNGEMSSTEPFGNDESADDKVFKRDNKAGMVRIQGDMLLTKEQLDELIDDNQDDQSHRTKRQAYTGKSYPNTLWPDNKVYYGFYPNATDGVKRVIRKAAAEWAKETCLQFEEVKLEDVAKVPNIIGVYSSFDCFSRVGKIGGIQGLSLDTTCETVGHAVHELGHAIGLIHTHMRYDRNNFIKIIDNNIMRGWGEQFSLVSKEYINNYNITYDFGSVMQYPPTSESRNGENTMEPHDKNYLQTLGSHIISFYDKLMVNRHYKCLELCNVKRKWYEKATAVCKNGGFPNPKDCTTCVCPSGYGGKLCDQRPKGCGKTLLATTKLQALKDTVGYGRQNYGRNDEYKMCHYWIEGLPGSTIEIKIRNYRVITNGKADEGCRDSGVEIKTGNDTGLTGYRFCRYGYESITLRSASHIVPVITYSAVENKDTVLTYQIVSYDPNFKCEDGRLCSALKGLNICEGKQFFDKVRRKMCAKSCGYCM